MASVVARVRMGTVKAGDNGNGPVAQEGQERTAHVVCVRKSRVNGAGGGCITAAGAHPARSCFVACVMTRHSSRK